MEIKQTKAYLDLNDIHVKYTLLVHWALVYTL